MSNESIGVEKHNMLQTMGDDLVHPGDVTEETLQPINPPWRRPDWIVCEPNRDTRWGPEQNP